MSEYIKREAAIEICETEYQNRLRMLDYCGDTVAWNIGGEIKALPAVDVEKMSDGYHTFADLYEQRLILSAALAKNNPHAWKSKRHEDGSVPFGGGWFIMGFDTDEGCYTYHYELKDWDLFQCKELGKGKPWDGHTSKDVRRLLSIPAADVAPVVRCENCRFYSAGDLRGLVGGECASWTYCEVLRTDMPPRAFCSYGKRKEKDDAEKD